MGDGVMAAASRTSAVSSAPVGESEKSAGSVMGVDLKTVIALGVFRLRCCCNVTMSGRIDPITCMNRTIRSNTLLVCRGRSQWNPASIYHD